MNTSINSLFRSVIWALTGMALGISSLHAQTVLQTVDLEPGWNAVWLEVEPVYQVGDTVLNVITDDLDDEIIGVDDIRIGQRKAPQDVFSSPEVTRVTMLKELVGLDEFFSSQSANSSSYDQESWELYLRDDPAGSTNLFMVSGNRPFLVKLSDEAAPVSISVSGRAGFYRPEWVPDRYNLIGFGVDGTISFQDFFAPSGGTHSVAQIHSLAADGNWSIVTPGDPIETGVAYWIFSSGPSDYMGPVAVDFEQVFGGGLSFSGPSDTVSVDPDDVLLDLEELVFTNLSATNTASPELELIAEDGDVVDLELHVVNPVPNTLAYEIGNQVDSVANDGSSASLGETVAPRTTAQLTLGAKRNWDTGAVGRTNVYRLRTGGGNAVWLPISATQGNLQNAADLLPESDAAGTAGLWVGEVIVDGVTSIVEDDAPVKDASGSAPLRLILHSNDLGEVSLLSQVTVMQTKTADADVESEPVLVVDPAQIPYFEGIQERNGKRVGLRIQSVAYDMPRKLDLTTQSALVTKAAAAVPPETLAGEADVLDYLIQSNLRPSTLVEDYHLSLILEGALGAGKTVQTAADRPLVLDPFHRSNPFRHVYHQQHARGTNVTRTITVLFDDEQPIADQLTGTYFETLLGVTKSTLELSGRVKFQRVSLVTTLEQ
ncbi:MAG: hypothetical protein ACSHYA_12680 [Opitutaceae bacterium]